jgi:hypothetical protein
LSQAHHTDEHQQGKNSETEYSEFLNQFMVLNQHQDNKTCTSSKHKLEVHGLMASVTQMVQTMQYVTAVKRKVTEYQV